MTTVIKSTTTTTKEEDTTAQKNNDYDDDPNFDRKLDIITAGATPYVKAHLLTRISRENCKTIIEYILAMQNELSLPLSYRVNTILKLKLFSEFHKSKPFEEMIRQDVLDYLDSYRKPETIDTLHQWVGTYELSRITLLRFFKWLYAKDTPPKQRPKPPVMENISKLKRKETSIYKPTDMWSEDDDALFFKYCPFPRDRAWHAVSEDTGCRPHELLRLKIKDVVSQRLDSGHHIAKITVNGKTGTRQVRIHKSYPYVKDWLSNGHPFPNNPDSPLFCGVGKKAIGRRMKPHSINGMYDRYKKQIFPALLEDPKVSEEDKRRIRDLLNKRWNPYVRRHTTGTHISKTVKDPYLVNQYMGWSQKGNTRLKYQHYYNDDAFEAVLELADAAFANNVLRIA